MSLTKNQRTILELFPEASSLTKTLHGLKVWCYAHDDNDPWKVFVPRVEPTFVFQSEVLEALILGEVLGKHTYLYGDTGSGKTASVLQFCARRGKEIVRQNFDEHVSRAELLGMFAAVADESTNHLVMKFRRGSLALSVMRPCTFLLDEYDMGTPGSTIVVNLVLESEEPVLHIPETEEIIRPNKEWRVVATGNTDGVNPDPRGIYAGTQTQNFASLNRFAFRCRVNYNTPEREKEILQKKYEKLPATVVDPVIGFTRAYRAAFDKTGELTVPFSTRLLHNLVEATVFLGSVGRALDLVLLSVLPPDERATVVALASRNGISVK